MNAAIVIPALRKLAEISAEQILPYWNVPGLEVEMKADQTPVTMADRKAEEVMRDFLARTFPDHGVVGEEFPQANSTAEYTWVLDPIDGTKTFAAGCPLYGTLIGLRKNSRAVWGAIHLPALGLLYIGDNEHTWCNERQVQMRFTPQLAKCTLLTTDPRTPSQVQNAVGWHQLLASTGMYRSWGDCFGYTLVAGGGADIMCDPQLNLWDVVALLPVLRGAGAMVRDWQGNQPDSAGSLVAAHPAHMDTILACLNTN